VSGLDRETMTVLSEERGGDPGRPGKKDPLDALVWLAARPGEPAWEAPFGPGRPGWHVECAAIATRYLGPVFDVQAGGTDLIFPHHEMSASHARVALGEAEPVFARRYAHAGMVRLDGEKMSKSLGNLVFVSVLLAEGADPMAIRLAILAHGYRHDWDWSQPGLAAAAGRLARWRQAVGLGAAEASESAASADPALADGPVPSGESAASGGPVPSGEPVLAAVRERLADDLDAPGALAAVDRWADAVIAAGSAPPGAARLVRDTVDALLGIAL
jgi:L-cysteine:1D-myo-inositol 2-amino-2-deoxy-alpha-D-glucopyranoside ligase